MGGCASKPKTTEYEGLMDPQCKGYGVVGRNSMDMEDANVDADRQSEDNGLKVFGRSNSAQKGSERSLQNLFVKIGQPQERGDGNLDANNDATLRDVLRSFRDPKKQTIGGLNPETNLLKTEETESDPKQDDGLRDGAEEPIVTKSPGRGKVATENAKDEPVVPKKSSLDEPSSLSSNQGDDAGEDCAVGEKTKPQSELECREMPQGFVVCSAKQSLSHERSLPGRESTEAKASDRGNEVASPVHSDCAKEETSGSVTIRSPQALETAQAITLTRTLADNDAPVELKAAAHKELPFAKAPKSAESEELGSGEIQEKIECEIPEEARIADENDLTHENGTTRDPDVSACLPVIVDVRDAKEGKEVFEVYGTSTEVNTVNSLEHGVAERESPTAYAQLAPIGAQKGLDQSSALTSVELTESSRNELADKVDEACAEMPLDVEQSVLIDKSASAKAESAEFPVEDEKMNPMSTVDELQPRLAPNEIPRKSSLCHSGTLSTVLECGVSNVNVCEKNQENIGVENILLSPETELNPQGTSVESTGSKLHATPETNFPDSAPDPLQASMHPKQDQSASSPDLYESEASARQNGLGKGNVQELQQPDVPSTQEGSNFCDHDPPAADGVVEMPQGFQGNSGELTSLEDQHQALSPAKHCLELTARIAAQKVSSPQMRTGEVTPSDLTRNHISKEIVLTHHTALSDIDQVLEKLASEFERQASAEMGEEVHQECSAIPNPSVTS